MASPESIDERLAVFIRDTELAHRLVHGRADETVQTEGGPLATFARMLAVLRGEADTLFGEFGLRPPFLGDRTTEQINELNEQIAAGESALRIGTTLNALDGPHAGRTFILQGTGTSAAFVPMGATMAEAPLGLSGTPVTSAVEDMPYQGFLVYATGGAPPYSFEVMSGPLQVDAGGFVSWPQPVEGTYPANVIRVIDGLSAIAHLPSFPLTVVAATESLPVGCLFLGDSPLLFGDSFLVLS
jgi:hypothetical protein